LPARQQHRGMSGTKQGMSVLCVLLTVAGAGWRCAAAQSGNRDGRTWC
jgi:hypothetical protein